MIQKIFIAIICCCFFSANIVAQNKNNFQIEVTVSDAKDGILLFRNLTNPLPDTLKIKNGVAKFNGYTKEPLPHIIADEANKYQPSTTDQITSLKSQLKHCKNYLERQNIERELNRLYKERR